MPEISRFMGIVIQMYYDDHSIPHIHARYSESRCKIDIEGNLMGGDIPLSKLHIIKRWINLHKAEILKNLPAASRLEIDKKRKASRKD